MKIISYPLSANTPLYPNTPILKREEYRSVDRGDSSTNSLVTLPSHYGTHLDAPRHFCPHGKAIADFTTNGVINFKRVYCVDIPKAADTPITVDDIMKLPESIRDADGLLIRTGFWKDRFEDPAKYTHQHPWVPGDLPGCIRELFPNLRLYGSDTISVSSPLHREEGHAAHKAFLCDADRAILLLEDVNLGAVESSDDPFEMTVIPYFDEAMDGSPVVVVVL